MAGIGGLIGTSVGGGVGASARSRAAAERDSSTATVDANCAGIPLEGTLVGESDDPSIGTFMGALVGPFVGTFVGTFMGAIAVWR
jgi:hypothetical protein